jgi:nucleoside-diphosphate-sugar epimerase
LRIVVKEGKGAVMKVFVAGATGALGRQLVPMLVRRGHEVAGMTRTESKRPLVEGMGAHPVVADALDPEAVGRAVSETEPEVIVHELTAIPGSINMRRLDRDFAATNRLRTGTDHLLATGRAAGVRRFVAQSFASYFARSNGAVKTEEDPLDPDPPAAIRSTLEAIRHVEAAVTSADWAEGVILRYGAFYGPGTSFAVKPPGELAELIRKRMLPIVGSGGGVWSFVHIEDAATATVEAVEHGAPGIYHAVDDEPAPVREWLPVAADAVGAKRPLRLPRWLGRLVAGEAATVMMTEARGASNAKAKRELGWRPRYPSWRRGFVAGLG